jgi:hypothetical protein
MILVTFWGFILNIYPVKVSISKTAFEDKPMALGPFKYFFL